MDITTTDTSRVANGVEWLDQTKPEWRSLIDLDHLRMHSIQSCVLGQVFRDEAYKASRGSGYSHIYESLPLPKGIGRYQWMIDHGFEYGPLSSYEELTEAWREAIEEGEVTR